MGLGVAARGLNDFALARTQYQKASEIDKNRTDYIYNVGLLEMDYENDGTPAGFKKAAGVFELFLKNATPAHAVDPDGKGPQLSFVDLAKKRIATCNKAIEDIKQAEIEMAELQKMQAEQEKVAKDLAEQQKMAAELASKEASGAAAPAEGEAVDEAAVEAELAAEEAAAAKKAADEKTANDAKKKSDEASATQDAAAKEESSKAKEAVKLE